MPTRITPRTFWLARALRTFTRWYFIPQTLREKLCRFAFKPNGLDPFPFEVPLNGLMYQGDISTYQDWRIFFLGSFERETINLLAHILRSHANPVFIDIGANVGLFAAVLSRFCREVHAFEPYRPLQESLRALLRRNHIENVRLHPVDLGRENAVLPYYPPSGSNIGVG